MKVIVDTNVAIVANRKAPQASAQCVLQCIQTLQEVTTTGVLVIDDGWRIITEYKKNLQQSGQPGVGDAFCKWVLTNWRNPSRCETVTITQQPASTDPTTLLNFPMNQLYAPSTALIESMLPLPWPTRKRRRFSMPPTPIGGIIALCWKSMASKSVFSVLMPCPPQTNKLLLRKRKKVTATAQSLPT